ncbi:hypothetical protein [Glaciecola sp. 1036]|uniref:hypothetical protein n=1 Tax=Alteromonadaceae TaxID=72275 RepID=UPI003D00601C
MMHQDKLMFKFIVLLSILLCVSCTKNTDEDFDEVELKSNYESYSGAYSKLKDMMNTDSKEMAIFEIGIDSIGDYKFDGDGWYKNYKEYVSYDVVLGVYMLSDERIQNYIGLLKETGAQKVEFYRGNVAITVLANGFVFGGCLSQIYFHPVKTELERPSWTTTYYSARFSENWSGETKCN